MEHNLFNGDVTEEEIDMFFYDSGAAVDEDDRTESIPYTLVPEAPAGAWLHLLGHTSMFIVIIRPFQWIVSDGTIAMIELQIDIFAI